jgi:hypothetical protein
MEHLRSILLETIQFTDTADHLWISDVYEGFISPSLLGPATHDSWRIDLQFVTEKNAQSERLEQLGFKNGTVLIASVFYSITGEEYCVIQNPVGLPGAQNVTEHTFDNPADALLVIMEVIATIDYENKCHFPIAAPVKKAFKPHWYDRIVLSRTIYNHQHVGVYEDTLAIVTYGDETILRPLSKRAKLICAEHLNENTALPQKLGGYVLPKKWKPLVQSLHEECRGYVLYLCSIHG